jgi:hypothetical protein
MEGSAKMHARAGGRDEILKKKVDEIKLALLVRRHYIRLEQEGTKIDAMARLQAYDQCPARVQ